MGFWDYLFNAYDKGAAPGNAPDPTAGQTADRAERDRLASIGQNPDDPRLSGTTFEGPGSYVSKPEQDVLFPRGLPDQAHQGGLAQQAAFSRMQDQQRNPPPSQDPTDKLKEKAGPEQPKAGRVLFTGAPDKIAAAERSLRQAGSERSLAHAVGTIIRIAASAGAGGAAAGAGGGAGAGAAGGAAGGAGGAAAGGGAGAASAAAPAGGAVASSGSGFGGNFLSGMQSGAGFGGSGGSGLGGYAGRLAGKEAMDYAQSGGGGGGGAPAGGGSGGSLPSGSGFGQSFQPEGGMREGGPSGNDINFFEGGKRRVAMGILSGRYDPGLVSGNTYWSTLGTVA